jgi:hypothetical protein
MGWSQTEDRLSPRPTKFSNHHAFYTSARSAEGRSNFCCQLVPVAWRFEHQLIAWLHIAVSSDRWLMTSRNSCRASQGCHRSPVFTRAVRKRGTINPVSNRGRDLCPRHPVLFNEQRVFSPRVQTLEPPYIPVIFRIYKVVPLCLLYVVTTREEGASLSLFYLQINPVLSGSLVTTSRRVLRLRMEQTASRYLVCWINSLRQPIRGAYPAWELSTSESTKRMRSSLKSAKIRLNTILAINVTENVHTT